MLVSWFFKCYLPLVAWQYAIVWTDNRAGLHGAAIFSVMLGACWLIYAWYSTTYEIDRDVARILDEISRQSALNALSPEVRNG